MPRDRSANACRAPWWVTIISRTPAPSTRCRHCSAVALIATGKPELARGGDGLRRAAGPPERQHLDAVAAQQRDPFVVVEHVLAPPCVAIDQRPRALHVDPGGPDDLAGRRGAPARVAHGPPERGDGPLGRRVAGHRPADGHAVGTGDGELGEDPLACRGTW